MQRRPNILLVLTDDHAAPAIGAYGSRMNTTPNIDKIAFAGMRFDRALVNNSLCTPARAAVLTGTYSHVNGVTTLATPIDASQPTFVSELKAAGYRTAMFGKWHLGHGEGHDPQGFDHWEILDDQGTYHDPVFLTADGKVQCEGYVTDILTDRVTAWLDEQPADQPWCALVWHKAPHRPWLPHERHKHLFTEPIPLPETFDDDYRGRATPAHHATMRIADDLADVDLKEDPPEGLDYEAMGRWKYQRYLADYLRCVAAVDENVGRLTDHVTARGEQDDTLTIYTADHGFFLGEHGWFDKRFMYEPSLRIPLVMSYPRKVSAGRSSDALVANVDLAQTILDAAGVPAHPRMQGMSLLPLLTGDPQAERRETFYYRFYEHDDHMHHVWAHYGIRTDRYKLIHYYADGLGLPNTNNVTYPPEWELFDLEADPHELRSVYHDPEHRAIREQLTRELARVQEELGDTPYERPSPAKRAAALGRL
ncbi:sulfatase family protein [Streptomyces sp. BH097]|uniref:sulfatase family protein n=1 Tax=unclassified Streptomyces TaxID=2593676 RepID=UPI003BB7B94C